MGKRAKYKRKRIGTRLLELRARVAESVNAPDLKSDASQLAGSTPALRTNTDTPRTDAVAKIEYASQFEYSAAMTKHARELERQLYQAVIRLGNLAITLRPVSLPVVEPPPPKTVGVPILEPAPVAAAKTKWTPKKASVDSYQDRLGKLSNDEVMEKLRRHGCIGVRRIDESKVQSVEASMDS